MTERPLDPEELTLLREILLATPEGIDDAGWDEALTRVLSPTSPAPMHGGLDPVDLLPAQWPTSIEDVEMSADSAIDDRRDELGDGSGWSVDALSDPDAFGGDLGLGASDPSDHDGGFEPFDHFDPSDDGSQ